MRETRKRQSRDCDEVTIILDSISDGVFTVDKDLTITSFNRAAEHITGFSAEEAVGEKCYNIFRTSVCQKGCLLNETLNTGRPVTGLEVTILNRRNEEVPISVSTAVLLDRDGSRIGGVETFRDMTAVDSLRREIRKRHSLQDMVSKNHRMQQVFALLPDVANSQASVLLLGDTGTGKDLLARAIHNESRQKDGPFVKVNCGALPDTLLESELFGHVAGAFTDARRDRVGRFELAAGGTIFLDEIGDTSPMMQVKLLRVLQDGTFEPVGSTKTRKTDARIIAATHRNLAALVEAGQFRQDLYYRINTMALKLPPLRERREDIPLLVEHFIDRFSRLSGKDVRTVAGDAMRHLMSYHWPGNVRQLEHALEHAFVLVKGNAIELSHLPEEITTHPKAAAGNGDDGGEESPLLAFERNAIEEALARNRWNKVAASKDLGISRSTLWRKMKKLGISRN